MNSLSPLKPRKRDDQSIIPMINIVFLLLIFFMIAGQISSLRWPEIDLPQFSLGVAATTPERLISISINGELRLNDTPIALTDVPQALADWPSDQGLTVVADRRLSAGRLNELLAELRKVGIAHIALLTAPAG